MRVFCLTTAAAMLFTSVNANAQLLRRGGGLFGLKQEEQISSGLFPTEEGAVEQASDSSETIFKKGEPGEVESVSYVIQDGEKVETSKSKEKSGFGFFKGKKEDGAPVIDPVPAQVVEVAPPVSENSKPQKIERLEKPEVAAPAPSAITEPQMKPIAEVVAEPAFVEEKKKKGGFFSFGLKKDKNEEVPAMPREVPVASVVEPAPVTEKPKPVAPAPVVEKKPEVKETAPAPEFAAAEPPAEMPEKKESGGILAPIRNVMPPLPSLPSKPQKEIDMTGAETIIADGEIVDSSNTGFVADGAVEGSESAGTREPPKVINGVKTYSSWDDVEAQSVSAADKILNQIR